MSSQILLLIYLFRIVVLVAIAIGMAKVLCVLFVRAEVCFAPYLSPYLSSLFLASIPPRCRRAPLYQSTLYRYTRVGSRFNLDTPDSIREAMNE